MDVTKRHQGRPQELAEGKRVNVYLDAETLSRAKEIGHGNLSEGLRKAIKNYEDWAMYNLISTKGNRQFNGSLDAAIQSAIAMEAELQPAFGVTVEDAEGNTVAEIRDGQLDD
jgi:hypothetical protein